MIIEKTSFRSCFVSLHVMVVDVQASVAHVVKSSVASSDWMVD